MTVTFVPPPNWYKSAWKCVAMVTIDHTKVGGGSETQSDFPVLICGEQITDNRFWYRVLSTGADIVVTSSDGKTKLKRELVSISKTNKTMELYVRVPSVSHLTDTVLYIYFHNPAGAETNDLDTWDSNYIFVHHMNDNPDTSTVQDSTVNNEDGAKGAAGQPVEATGIFGGDKSQEYDATDDYISVAHNANQLLTTGGTIESIIYPDTSGEGTVGRIVDKSANATAGNGYTLTCVGANLRLVIHSTAAEQKSIAYAAWHHVATTWNSAGTITPIYIDGASGSTHLNNVAPVNITTVNALRIGQRSAATDSTFDGKIAEVRISNCVRSAGWISTTYTSTLGYATFLTVTFGTTYWDWSATEAGRTDYEIEIRDENGHLLWDLRDIESASLDRQVNNPATVSLVCPLSPQIKQIIPDLVRPNAIWVWQNGVLKFTGPLQIHEIEHGTTKSVRIDAQDYMVQLKGEILKYYDATEAADDHVEDILDEQESSTKVLLGTIEPTTSISATIERDYIYNVLMNLRDILGGYMVVDPDRKLNWYWSIAEDVNQRIEYRADLVSIKKKTDWINFGNRLYIYGDGCNLIDAGMTTEYIEDTDSIAQYGLCVRELYESNFRSAADMLRYAQLKILNMAWPRVSYEVNIVNLDDFGLSHKQMNLGSWVILVDPEIDIEVEVQIVRVVYDLVHGERVDIELAAKSIDICDIIPGEYILW